MTWHFNNEFRDEATEILKRRFLEVKYVDKTWDFECVKNNGVKYFIEVKSCRFKVNGSKKGRTDSTRSGRFWLKKYCHQQLGKFARESDAKPLYLFLLTRKEQVVTYKFVSYKRIQKLCNSIFSKRTRIWIFTHSLIFGEKSWQTKLS